MSGLEIIGIAASIIQIADLGATLSIKLFTFYHQVKNANQSIRNLSSDVALTCTILRQLGDNLSQDAQTKLCSDEAFQTAQDVLSQCREVFQQIQTMINNTDKSSQGRWRQTTRRIRNAFVEPGLGPLRENLDRLKSTMLLMLNVIMYAGQVRQNNEQTKLQEQRELIETLLEEKNSSSQGTFQPMDVDSQADILNGSIRSLTVNAIAASPALYPDLPPLDEVGEYSALFKKLLYEIDSCKSRLNEHRHHRLKREVLYMHENEVLRFQLTHGHSVISRLEYLQSESEEASTYAPLPNQSSPVKLGDVEIESIDSGFAEQMPVLPVEDTSKTADNKDERKRKKKKKGSSINNPIPAGRKSKKSSPQTNEDIHGDIPNSAPPSQSPGNPNLLSPRIVVVDKVGSPERIRSAHPGRRRASSMAPEPEKRSTANDRSPGGQFEDLLLKWTTLKAEEIRQVGVVA